MSRKAVAQLQDAGLWSATSASGQPTATLVVQPDAAVRLDVPVGAVVATAATIGDRVQAAVPPIDLRPFDDLELWVQADQPADGSEAAPWYLELRLGSAARPIGTQNNPWHRFLPLRGDGQWETVVVGLADLPAAVRQATDAVRFTCVDAGRSFRCAIDGPWAVQASVIADVDDALRTVLDGVLELANTPVPLAFEPGPAPAAKALKIRQVTTRLRPDLPTGGERRTDFSGHGYQVRPAAVPVELGYELRPHAADRADHAAILEFALTQLATRPHLDVAGRPAALQLVEPAPESLDLPVVTITVVTSLRPAAAAVSAVPPFHQVEVEVDDLAHV
ncbi:MAG TPA: hypothetical protein VGJ86_02690 [Acidimicrobiales bacterium]|jgi:hypothetical protein